MEPAQVSSFKYSLVENDFCPHFIVVVNYLDRHLTFPSLVSLVKSHAWQQRSLSSFFSALHPPSSCSEKVGRDSKMSQNWNEVISPQEYVSWTKQVNKQGTVGPNSAFSYVVVLLFFF